MFHSNQNIKKPTKNQAKSLLQQSTVLNDTDILSDEDEITQSNNIQTTKLRHSKRTHPLLYNILPNPTIVNNKFHFLIHPFFKYKKYFNYFFLPEDTQITIETIKAQQNQDTVLQKVYQWILNNERPLQIDPTIAANSFLLVY